MKLNGAVVNATYIETVVIPRNDKNYVFKARPLTEEDDKFFESVCPQPQPPTYMVPGGTVKKDETNATYVEAMIAWKEYRSNYLFLKSLEATEELEWDTVVMTDPTTWSGVERELAEAGFIQPEIIAIFNKVVAANGLDMSKIEKATKSFLATQAQEQN